MCFYYNFRLLMQNPISYQEAVHTVSLAARSRKVVNHAGLASKKETPKVKVDMEAKLRAWLDSKRKTKSYPRILGPFSPHMVKSPSSINHLKSPGSICSSAKNDLKTRGRLVWSYHLTDGLLLFRVNSFPCSNHFSFGYMSAENYLIQWL